MSGNITFLNLVAESMTGWSMQDAEGRPMAEVFQILDAATRVPIENPMQLAMGRDRTVHLPSNSILIKRDGRRRGVSPADRTKTLGVGEPEVQEDDVDRVGGEVHLRRAHVPNMGQVRPARALIDEHLAQQPCIAWIVLDEQDARDCGARTHQSGLCGKVTRVSQKSLMLRTRSSNSSSWTGFVT